MIVVQQSVNTPVRYRIGNSELEMKKKTFERQIFREYNRKSKSNHGRLKTIKLKQ